MRFAAGIILLARFASARLPGKALAPIGAHLLLEHCLTRLRAGASAQVVLATTTNPEDDALEAVATQLGVPVFRGAVDDVLGRCAAAAAEFCLDPVIRATGDNPGVDVGAPRRVLQALASTGADYVCEVGLPVGAAVEGITYAALCRAAHAATLPADREHVTTFVRANPATFRTVMLDAPADLRCPELSVTVDTPEDLAHVRALFASAAVAMPGLRQLIEAARFGTPGMWPAAPRSAAPRSAATRSAATRSAAKGAA